MDGTAGQISGDQPVEAASRRLDFEQSRDGSASAPVKAFIQHGESPCLVCQDLVDRIFHPY